MQLTKIIEYKIIIIIMVGSHHIEYKINEYVYTYIEMVKTSTSRTTKNRTKDH